MAWFRLTRMLLFSTLLAGAWSMHVIGQSGPQVLTLGTGTALGPFDPIRSTTSTNAWFLQNIYQNLLWSDGFGTFEPLLATAWEQETPTTWRFSLRDDVRFHDGTAFNADAVKFSLERIAGEESAHRGDFSWLTEVEVVDDLTVRVHTDGPVAAFLNYVGAFYYPFIVSPTAVARYGPDFAQNPVGTGPFRFDAHVSQSFTRIVRNDDYWGERPHLDEVTIRDIIEESARLTAMLTGEIDGVMVVGAAMLGRLKQETRFQFFEGPGTLVDRFVFNVTRPPFDDARVRQALAHAIDREAMLEVIFADLGYVFDGPIAPSLVGANAELAEVVYAYDPARARELLTEAGVPAGTVIPVWAATFPDHRLMVEVIEQNLADVGLVLSPTLMEATTLSAETRRGIHDAYMFGTYAIGDADRVLVEFECGNIPVGNRMMFCDPEIDALILAQRRETDPEQRRTIIAEIQRRLLHEVGYIPFRARVEVQVLDQSVQGWSYHPEAWEFWKVWIER